MSSDLGKVIKNVIKNRPTDSLKTAKEGLKDPFGSGGAKAQVGIAVGDPGIVKGAERHSAQKKDVAAEEAQASATEQEQLAKDTASREATAATEKEASDLATEQERRRKLRRRVSPSLRTGSQAGFSKKTILGS